MGQFLDYIASVFSSNKLDEGHKENLNTSNHVTFADNSFTSAFSSNNANGTKNEPEKLTKSATLSQSNRKTIYLYQAIGAVAFIAYLSMVLVPRVQLDSFNLLEPAGWQLVTLTTVPLVVYIASIGAMFEVNRPLTEGVKVSAKNLGLDLNSNEFVYSLKIIMVLMAICQLSSIISDQFLWLTVMIVPLWCYQLTSKLAHNEYQRYASIPKKQWVKSLSISKSPKPSSPVKQAAQQASKSIDQARATPRTRTRRAVKNIITGVSDKYHAFEQNVAHQLSQKIFTPLSPKLKMID